MKINRFERGQALIIIALALVGLVGIAGLVIDGGNAFQDKQRAQNAVDSAALASAHARIAGQRWCCEAAISEIAIHSSAQKPGQPTGQYSILRVAEARTALTQQASSVTARLARSAPSAREYSFQPFSQQEMSPVS